MRKSVIFTLSFLIIAIGVGDYFLARSTQTVSTQPKITVIGSNPNGNSPPASQTTKTKKANQTTVSPVSGTSGTNVKANDPGPGTVIFPAESSSTSGKNSTSSTDTAASSLSNVNAAVTPSSTSGKNSTSSTDTAVSSLPSVNAVVTPDEASSSSDSNSSSNGGSNNGSNGTLMTAPLQSAPKNVSPAPPTQMPSTGTPSESLSKTSEGQLILGAPANLATYPIIKDGSSYQGTIEPSSNLSQADITRLAKYPTVSATDIGEPSLTQEQIIKYPMGTYATNSYFKNGIDGVIQNMGPHIQRKLQTSEWTFTPAPIDSYVINGTPLRGSEVIRGVLSVKYDTSNNPLHLTPNVWYRGDVEMGMDELSFFTNNPQDRIVRRVLIDLIILGNWGQI